MKQKLSQPHLRLLKSEATNELLKDHNAFILFTYIALRAKRSGDFSVHGLTIGEALLGDHDTYGMSRQTYRTALAHLKKYQIINHRTTNKGTIVKIVCKTIFDINQDEDVKNLTNEQPSSNHYQEGKEYKEKEVISKDISEDSLKVPVESKKETITQATYQNNSEPPLQSSAKVSPPKPHGDPGVNRVMALLTKFCTEKLGRGTFSDPQHKQRFNASNILKLGYSDEEMVRRLTVILEGGNNFKISKMKSVYGMWDLIKNFDKSDEAEAQKQKELAKWKEQKKAEAEKPSTLARWNQESTTMKSPVMQKIEANTLPVVQAKPVADTPEKKRVANLHKMFEELGVKRGIPMKFGVAACDIVKINASDEEILRAGEHMLDLEIRKHQDLPASERIPLKEFPIRFIALSRELGRASHDLVVG